MAWGRVALLLVAAESKRSHIDELAEVLAYSAIKPKPFAKSVGKPPDTQIKDETKKNQIDSVQADIPKMIFWQITRIITLQEPDNTIPVSLLDKQKAADFDPEKKGTFVFEAPKPLATLTQLTPLLINSLGRKVTGRHIDDRKVVRSISQGKSIKKLFYLQETKWPLQLTIILDKHDELYPYWLDYDAIVKQLQKQLGECNVQVISVHARNLDDFVAQKHRIHRSLLILSDLQDYANSHRYWAWQAILEYVQKQTTQILALSSAKQSPQKTKYSAKARINSLKPLQGYTRHAKTHPFTEIVSAAQMDDALTMISPLAMVDNGLLRKLRTRFNWGSAALEGEIWNDKRVVQDFMGIRLHATEQQAYRERFSDLPASTQQSYWELVEAHHKKAYQGLLNLQGISKIALSKTPDSQTIDYFQSLLAYYHQSAKDHSQTQLNAQLKSIIDFSPLLASSSSKMLSDLLHQTYALAYQNEIRKGEWSQSLPAGLDPNKIPDLDGQSQQAEQQYYTIQSDGIKGNVKVFQKAGNKGTVLLNFSASDSQPAFWQESDNGVQTVIKNAQSLKLREKQIALIKTAQMQWQVEGFSCPDFAQNIGQDQQGLFIDTELNNPEKRYYWLPAEEDKNQKKLAGVWFPQKQLPESIQRDQYGIYTDINIKKIIQRFRYIAPGSFLMGSPEGEPERKSGGKETQHQVTLTKGFWLADTTVTQALYQTVMGGNPSHFTESSNNPVEWVSWNDAQQFIEKLNATIPALQARLPNEAEWEYACRAGSETPFSFGDNITLEQVNYDDGSLYAEGKQANKGKTVTVKTLPANPWGLYEMHGNVVEWCVDGYQEDLGKLSVTDPVSTEVGAECVVRGGSWVLDGRHARSAARHGLKSGFREYLVGFRLVLGFDLQRGWGEV